MAKGILKLEDGREVEIEYNPNDYKRKNPYERVAMGKKYWFVDSDGEITDTTDHRYERDNEIYEYGNYINDEEYCKKIARANGIRNNLRRFSREHDGDKINWYDVNQAKHSIGFSYENQTFYIYSNNWWCRYSDVIYFYTKEVAKQALEEFKDELLWFYTESGL